MSNKLTSMIGKLFNKEEDVVPAVKKKQPTDSIILKLRKINTSLECSREILLGEMSHYTDAQKEAMQKNIAKDVMNTRTNINTMMQSLLQYVDILKKRLYQHHLFKNEAYDHAADLYDLTFQACLWIPKSDALIMHSQSQFQQHSHKIKMLLDKIGAVLKAHQAQPNLIRANKNHEWLVARQQELEHDLEDEQLDDNLRAAEECQLTAIKDKLFGIEPVSQKIQDVDYAILEAIHKNGLRFYESLYVQNTLNCLRLEVKEVMKEN